jgi:uncharacterized repeat protein (TIGR03803 family)
MTSRPVPVTVAWLAAFVALAPVDAALAAPRFTTYTLQADLDVATGDEPQAGLVVGADGALYGTAMSGGLAHLYNGTIYRRAADGTVSVVHEFDNATEGQRPAAKLLRMPDGSLWGSTSAGGPGAGGTVFRFDPVSGVLTVLHAFTRGADGASPNGELVRASNGLVYGTTVGAGTNGGTIYRIRPATGTYTRLYTFAMKGNPLGHGPAGGLAQAADGRLYGTTSAAAGTGVGGAVFRFDIASGAVTLVHALAAATEGCAPEATLLAARNGELYGTASRCGALGWGSVFSVRTDGTFTLRHGFGYFDGAVPFGGLVEATDGYLYGTTTAGGQTSHGTAFRMKPDGSDYGLVMSSGLPGFGSYYPKGTLVQAGDALWGTSASGGATRQGTFFSLTPVAP